MKCRKCSHDLAEDAKFCNKCGAEVKKQKNHCEKCNHELREDDEFCKNCGEKVHKKVNIEKEKDQMVQKTSEVPATTKKSKKGLIGLIMGVVVIAVIVLVVVNIKDTDDNKVVEEEEPNNEIEDYSIEGLSEHYGIEEDLLTYEEMSDAVNRIEADYAEDIKGLNNEEKSMYIEEIIEEEYGEWNSLAYSEGYLITEGMSDSDKQQVIASLLGNFTYKNIRNPINGVYQLNEVDKATTLYDLIGRSSRFGDDFDEEDEEYFMMVGNTEGYYDLKGINLGYPTFEVIEEDMIYGNGKEDILVNVNFTTLIKEDMTPEEMKELILKSIDLDINGSSVKEYIPNVDEMIEEINDEFEEEAEEIYPRNTYHALFGVFLPIEDVVEGYKGESISELEEELKNGELGVPKINLEGHEIEFIYPEEDSPVNPDNVE